MALTIGTAGWSIPRADAGNFPGEGTALARYAQVFDGVEVNSSFYRSHRTATWTRWAQSVPSHFRFSVKIPKAITHEAKLYETEPLITKFAGEVAGLGAKLAVLLVQLPPKLAFDGPLTSRFFASLRQSIDAEVACEPRHVSWFEKEADNMLERLGIARVAADPQFANMLQFRGDGRDWFTGVCTVRLRCIALATPKRH